MQNLATLPATDCDLDPYLVEARDIENEISDRVANAKNLSEKCERRKQQLQMAIDSDLFKEFETNDVAGIQDLAASVRIKSRLLAKQLDRAHELADACDESATLHQAAERLDEPDRQDQATRKFDDALTELKSLCREVSTVSDMLKRQHEDHLMIFERMRR